MKTKKKNEQLMNELNELRLKVTELTRLHGERKTLEDKLQLFRNLTNKSEEELRGSREFIRSILDTVDEGFIVIDRDYRIISANNAYSRQASIPLGEIIGKHCYEISHQQDRPCYETGEECGVRRTFESGEPYTCVHRHQDKDGTVIYVEAKSYPLKAASGAVTSAIEVINNITEKYLLEEQVLRNQKLEAVGLLAGGIAHDFNNLLQGVFGSISLAREFADRNSAISRLLDDAERSAHLARSLTKQLLTFSKGGEPVISVIAPEEVLTNSAKFALSGSNVDFQFMMDDDLWAVEADEGQIGQVIQNIVLNASDAMPSGGTVILRAQNMHLDKESNLPLNKGRYVKITIEDSGVGIPSHHLSRIFDPYFTTKQKGTGLGLATSYSIIKKHKGLLDVKSEYGAGSTFILYLPAAAKSPLSVPKAARQGIVKGSGRVLVMDDEDIIRLVAGSMLKSLGYDADFAENGEQAIILYENALRSNKTYEAVILDLTIRGGIGGTETIKRLRKLDPGILAIVSSGYSDDSPVSQYREFGFQASLSKPYTLEGLSEALNAVKNASK